jgi:Phosphoribosyltransferase
MTYEGMALKCRAVTAAVHRAQKDCELRLQQPRPTAEDVCGQTENAEYARKMLQEVGGLEIAAMTGAIMHAKEVCSCSSLKLILSCIPATLPLCFVLRCIVARHSVVPHCVDRTCPYTDTCPTLMPRGHAV